MTDDTEIFDALDRELKRQREALEMIPSENFVSIPVMRALGSVLTNKYSEGYPGKRYYGGNQFIDTIERLAVERAKALFKVPHANVQPYSGSPANLAVYLSICKPGDVIMGQELTSGGHLTHGWKSSATGQLFNSVQYHVNRDGYIDIEEVRSLAERNRPKLIWVGSTAYSREFPFKELSEISDSVGAYLAADISHIAGLVVAGVHTSPVPYAHIITATTHKTLRGPRGAIIMVTERGLEKDPELGDKIDRMVFPGLQGGPHDNAMAGIAIALHEASTKEFREYAERIVSNSRKLASTLTKKGIKVVSGGTDNHMMVLDLTPYGRGKGVFVQEALEQAGIIVNKNTVPDDPSSPFYPSGIRIGTPALTTRGMGATEMEEIGNMIEETIMLVKNEELPNLSEERKAYIQEFRGRIKGAREISRIKEQVSALCRRFPLYEEL